MSTIGHGTSFDSVNRFDGSLWQMPDYGPRHCDRVTEVVRCIVVLDEVQALVLILRSDPVPADLLDE